MEMDDDDPRSWQWVMYDDEKKKKPIAVVRLVPPPHAPHEHLNPVLEDGVDPSEAHARHDLPFVKLTRVAVLPEYRGMGLSRELIEQALNWAAEHPEGIETGLQPGERWEGLVLVHSQVQIEALYRRMGFETDRGLGTWAEEGIRHVGMWRTIKVKPRPTVQ
jgi:predicted GNAT family N-acyltransferase